MKIIREFEEAVAKEVKSRKVVCPCHLYSGEEAIAVGVCENIKKEDSVYGNHRSHGHYLACGGDPKKLWGEIKGELDGCSKGYGGSMHIVDEGTPFRGSSAIVGGSIPLAVGSALKFKLFEEKNVSVTFFGDGAVSEGVFFESLNIAKLKNLPVLFICENNLYSTHIKSSENLANPKVVELAKAFHIPSKRINGNKVKTVYKASQKAIKRARGEGGPFLLECMTYRHKGHVGPETDLDKKLRSREEWEEWKGRDPLNMEVQGKEILDQEARNIIRGIK